MSEQAVIEATCCGRLFRVTAEAPDRLTWAPYGPLEFLYVGYIGNAISKMRIVRDSLLLLTRDGVFAVDGVAMPESEWVVTLLNHSSAYEQLG